MSGEHFSVLKEQVRNWCAGFTLRDLLSASDVDGDLWIVARKDDSSMDLKARRDMNVYLVEAPKRARAERLARLYVSEMPGASVDIRGDISGWAYKAEEDWNPLDEAAFSALICEWIVAYFSMKSVYYYA